MAGLSEVIHKFSQTQVWRDIRFGPFSLKIIDMEFVDYIVIFWEASKKNARHMLAILELFYNGTKQKINYSKSLLIAPHGMLQ